MQSVSYYALTTHLYIFMFTIYIYTCIHASLHPIHLHARKLWYIYLILVGLLWFRFFSHARICIHPSCDIHVVGLHTLMLCVSHLIFIRVSITIQTHIHTHNYAPSHRHTYCCLYISYMSVSTHTHTHTFPHTHTCTSMRTWKYIHSMHQHTRTHTGMVRERARTLAHTYAHVHT